MKARSLILAGLLAGGAASVAWAHPGFAGGPGQLLRDADANHDGSVTREELLQAADRHFDQVDADHDGHVTAQERMAFFKQMREKFASEHAGHMGERFATRDTDHDGRLSRNEVSRMPDARFAELDKNKDGYLTPDEFKAAIHDRMEWRKHRAEKWHEHADGDHDGTIDRNEMHAQVEQRFARLDKNKDGVLSGDELDPHAGSCPFHDGQHGAAQGDKPNGAPDAAH